MQSLAMPLAQALFKRCSAHGAEEPSLTAAAEVHAVDTIERREQRRIVRSGAFLGMKDRHFLHAQSLEGFAVFLLMAFGLFRGRRDHEHASRRSAASTNEAID